MVSESGASECFTVLYAVIQGHDLISQSHRQHNKRHNLLCCPTAACAGRVLGRVSRSEASGVEMDQRMSRETRIVIPSPVHDESGLTGTPR